MVLLPKTKVPAIALCRPAALPVNHHHRQPPSLHRQESK
ncbi:hypothetical protein A2U01_0074903, partial [Trifolium medium]|nr:hypothetical protein [Trifolium medium]